MAGQTWRSREFMGRELRILLCRLLRTLRRPPCTTCPFSMPEVYGFNCSLARLVTRSWHSVQPWLFLSSKLRFLTSHIRAITTSALGNQPGQFGFQGRIFDRNWKSRILWVPCGDFSGLSEGPCNLDTSCEVALGRIERFFPGKCCFGRFLRKCGL